MQIDLVTLVVADYDEAIAFYADVLGFEVAQDAPATTNDGRPKRWVVLRPPGGGIGLLLARADGPRQGERVGDQTGGRVSFFLHVDDFAPAYERLVEAGVSLVGEIRHEPYGTLQVFDDLYGNRWDLLGPPASPVA